MKKVLRFLFILILILFVGYLILCATSPKEVNVEKTTTINAPAYVVWSQAGHYEHWESWSPWKEMDSTVKSTVTGPSGDVGSKYEWTSEKMGSGYMTIASVDDYSMKYDMQFTAPFQSSADGTMKVEPADGGSKVTWGFHTTVPFMRRGFFALVMQKQLEASFERGLELLKERIESGEAKLIFNINKVTFPATEYATVRKTISMSEMEAFFNNAFGTLMEAVGDGATGYPAAIYYTWDMENSQTNCAAAVPVATTVKGMEMKSIPASEAYVVKYTGPYSGLQAAHEWMANEMMSNMGMEMEELMSMLVLEEYEVMPPVETDSNKYVTNIYYITQ